MEAVKSGYDEAIMLDPQGNVAEGSGENIFIVRRGELKTPPLTAILEGITRNSIIDVARHMGLTVHTDKKPGRSSGKPVSNCTAVLPGTRRSETCGIGRSIRPLSMERSRKAESKRTT
jgi:hypothetical protein